MAVRNWLAAAGFALALSPQLASADYWRYETETGGIAFTDDPKNIPAKYKAGAVAVKEESLFDYERLSVVDPVRPVAPTPGGVAEDSAVPVFAWPVGQAGPAAAPGSNVSVNVGGMQINVEGNGDEDEPLYVDRGQDQDLEGNYFDHGGIMSPTTIIRRGDKPLAYIDERGGP